MTLRTVLFILVLQLGTNDINSQLKVTRIKLDRPNEESFSFPLIHSTNVQVANKINGYLQKELLENETILTNAKSIFEKSRFISGDDSLWRSGYTSMDYGIEVSNTRVLSLSFQFETMGAYPESYQSYYSFQVQTGAHISAKDLFTPGAITELKKTIIKRRQKLIDEWMKEVDTTAEMKDDREYIKETLSNCNEEADEDNFIIEQNSIVFVKDHCFPHMARPYDIGLNIEMFFVKIERLLSTNGKNLLLQKH